MLTKLQNYWFAPSHFVDLAVLRIVACFAQFVLLIGVIPNRGIYDYALLQSTMADSFYEPLIVMNFLNLPLGWGERPEVALLAIVFYLAVVSGILAIIGLLSNISTFIFALSTFYLQAYAYSFGYIHHPEAVMLFCLFALSLSPAGRIWSVDWLIWYRKRDEGQDLLTLQGETAGWVIRFIQWFFVLMYISAVYQKLNTSGLGWANGYTLQYYLIQDSLDRNTLLGLWLAEQHLLVRVLQYLTLLFQSTLWLAVIFPKLRWIYVPVGLAFHVGILLTLKAPFYELIILYIVFIPWAQAFAWARGRRQSQNYDDINAAAMREPSS